MLIRLFPGLLSIVGTGSVAILKQQLPQYSLLFLLVLLSFTILIIAIEIGSIPGYWPIYWLHPWLVILSSQLSGEPQGQPGPKLRQSQA